MARGRDGWEWGVFTEGVVDALEARRVLGQDMTHEVVVMAAEEEGAKLLGEGVGYVEGCGNALKFDKVTLDPFT